ncbi:hypothetical protein BO221_36465 [Archangium sp. Cb G35]|uniref:LysM peptidoglycan-binding domain-containing protein n=1 Tax=Archangium sp. Cb G35 TaxID=1920190 RepID=UPI000936055A|nr:hypothetical protein [Archangium sp. Cb G35]OJT19015.1 hypothetical protein BO221_36465 [Archangium sp. Cb G35]
MKNLPVLALALVLCTSSASPAQQPPRFLQGLEDSTPVHLPWTEVRQLLERAYPPEASASFEYALGPGKVEGEVRERVLSATLELPLSVYSNQWVVVPLLASGSVRAARLDGRAVALIQEAGHSALLVKGPGEHRLSLEVMLALSSPDSAALSFETQVPLHWRLRLPGTTAYLEPAARQSLTRVEEGKVLLEAHSLPAARVQLDWSGARQSQVSARASAEFLTFVSFQEGTTSGRAHFAFDISGTRRDRLGVRLPPGLELLSVEGKELAGWSVEPAAGAQRLVLTLRRPQTGKVTVDLSFELPGPGEDAGLPSLYAEEVEEQQGYLAAYAESPLSLTHQQVAGGELMDAKHLPARLLRGVKVPFTLAYRAGGSDFAARVRLERNASVALAQATIDAAYYTTVVTDEGREVVKATFLVKNNLRPYLAVALPANATLWAAFVSGTPVTPATEGEQLLLPLVKSREVGEGDTLATHEVEEGWSLSDVAMHYYHDASKWRVIQQANVEQLGDGMNTQRGQLLRIPRLSGPGSDLETAFPVELVYSREAPRLGRMGSLNLELAVADLGVMRAVWTVYLPSRLEPLSFEGNLSQASHIRYGLLRRLRYLSQGTMAVLTPSLVSGVALAGEYEPYSLRKRFSKYELQEDDEALAGRPRDSLPLVGRPFVFKRYLLEGERPQLQAVYLDRALEQPVRTLMLLVGFVLALLLGRAARGGEPRRVWTLGLALVAYLGVGLLVGHFVLGTHVRVLLGLTLGGWCHLLQALLSRVRSAKGLRRWVGGTVLGLNGLALFLVVVDGLGPRTGTLAILCGAGGMLFLARTHAVLAASAASALLLLAPLSARAQELPGAEVTLPFGKLKGLLEKESVPTPPRHHVLVSAAYRGTLGTDSLEVEGELEVELLTEGWVSVPLVPITQSLVSLTVDGRPAGASVGEGHYMLTLRGLGRHQVRLTFVAPVLEPGRVPLSLVPGVPGTLGVRLPAAELAPDVAGGTEVKVQGATVTSRVPADANVELLWSSQPRKPEGGAPPAEEVRMTARTLQLVSVDERRARIYVLVRYHLQRGSTNRFSVELPPTVELLDVQAPGMADHQVVSEGGKRLLVVTTDSSVRDEMELSFACDWRWSQEGGALPVFSVPGVRSETGTLGIEAAGSREVRVAEVTGAATQVDVRSAPELFSQTDKPILHAIRYLRQPYGVKLSLVQHPEVELETATVDRAEYTTVIAGDGRAISQGVFKVRNARRAFLGVSLPPASEVQSVLIGGAPARPVRDGKGTLLLPLPRSASSDQGMQQFDVEVVYLTQAPEVAARAVLPQLLPAIDLRASKVSWSLYVPPGMEVEQAPGTEKATDSMQWATASRAELSVARGPQGRGAEVAGVGGGLLPVRFNLPTHGEPATYWVHYLPAGVAPDLAVGYTPRSLPPLVQALGGFMALALLVLLGLAVRRARAA